MVALVTSVRLVMVTKPPPDATRLDEACRARVRLGTDSKAMERFWVSVRRTDWILKGAPFQIRTRAWVGVWLRIRAFQP